MEMKEGTATLSHRFTFESPHCLYVNSFIKFNYFSARVSNIPIFRSIRPLVHQVYYNEFKFIITKKELSHRKKTTCN